NLPELNEQGLWPAQAEAIHNLEESLEHGRPRALIQMATGSGKTFTAANVAYRLIKHAGARRILFLVDRANLGRQTLKEFQAFSTPDDGRKFTELYNVQRLGSNRIDGVSRVVISTIQRLYSILKGEPDLPEELDEESVYDLQPSKPRSTRSLTIRQQPDFKSRPSIAPVAQSQAEVIWGSRMHASVSEGRPTVTSARFCQERVSDEFLHHQGAFHYFGAGG
ncbi:MAG: DEAD/DEAH box helicase family protein, partial [Candidatus Cybelea sp.]